MFGIIDGLDGKQSRVKIETTDRGKWEHYLDYIERTYFAPAPPAQRGEVERGRAQHCDLPTCVGEGHEAAPPAQRGEERGEWPDGSSDPLRVFVCPDHGYRPTSRCEKPLLPPNSEPFCHRPCEIVEVVPASSLAASQQREQALREALRELVEASAKVERVCGPHDLGIAHTSQESRPFIDALRKAREAASAALAKHSEGEAGG